MADFLPFSQSRLSNQLLTCEDGGKLISFTTWAWARDLHCRCIYLFSIDITHHIVSRPPNVTIHLGKTGSTLCPVSSLLAYLAICPATPGPLFLLRSGSPLSRENLVRVVCSDLSSTGIDASLFHGHNFRIHAATTANHAGLPDSTIKMLHQPLFVIFAPRDVRCD